MMKQRLVHWLERHFGQLFILYLVGIMAVTVLGLIFRPWLTLMVMVILGVFAVTLFTLLNLEANYHAKRS